MSAALVQVLLKLGLQETRQFFNAFFSLSDFHWQVGLQRMGLPATESIVRLIGTAVRHRARQLICMHSS